MYRKKLSSEGFKQHISNNKLRDVEDKYADDGHCFSLNREILLTYDLCASCESHALLYGIKYGLSSNGTIASSTTLKQLRLLSNTKDLIFDEMERLSFLKCPNFHFN